MKKKITINKKISVILSLVFITYMIPCESFADSGSDKDYIPTSPKITELSSVELVGEGTEESPYLIYNSDELITFRDKVNSGETEICGRLMDDIVLNQNFDASKFEIESYTSVTYDGGAVPEEFVQWEPIGNSYGNYYNGTFDGNGYTISGLYINDPEAWEQALFGCIYTESTIKDLGIINSCIIAQNNVSAVVVTNNGGNIENCYNSATVAGNDTISGIAAYSIGNVSRSYNTGNILGSSTTIGGVTGGNYGTVTECYNSGKVTGGEYVGAIAGMNDNYVGSCYNTGEVSGSSSVGGVVGFNLISMENCYNIGRISGNEDVGCIVGANGGNDPAGCYYLENDQAGNGFGTSISEEQFSEQDIFISSSWDFESTWIMDEELKRPVLQSMPEKVIRIAAADYVRTSNGYYINAVLTHPAENMVILSALYDDNGSIIAAACSEAYDGTYYSLNIAADKSGAFVKVFLWNNTGEIYPICADKRIDIE